MSSACFAVENIDNPRSYIIGGMSSGLRGASGQDAEATFNVYMQDLFKQAKSPILFSTVMYPDINALLSAFDKGKIDGFFATSLQYLLRKDSLNKMLIGIGYKNAEIKQSFFLVARSSDDITQLKDFRNKRISLASYMDLETLYLNTSLLRLNLPQVTEFFSEIKEPSSPNTALMDVFFNQSDVTIVRENEYNTAVELNPQLAKKLMIVEKSEPYISMVGAMTNKVSDEELIAAVASFNKVATTEKGLALMNIVSMNRIAILTSAEMMNLHNLVKENAALRQSLATDSIKPSAAELNNPKIKRH